MEDDEDAKNEEKLLNISSRLPTEVFSAHGCITRPATSRCRLSHFIFGHDRFCVC